MNTIYEVYYLPACPFCQKLKRAIADRQDVVWKDINQPEHQEFLITYGGKDQVPALWVDGHMMYETKDLIEFFRVHPEERS